LARRRSEYCKCRADIEVCDAVEVGTAATADMEAYLAERGLPFKHDN